MSLSILLFPILGQAVSLSGGDWSEFLGASCRGAVREDLPLDWSPDVVAWRTDLEGFGQSSPVVWDGVAYLTCVEGPKKEHCLLHAVSVEDGERLWTHEVDSSNPVDSNDYVSRAAPTPCADANGVYAFFESGDFVAVGFDGKERWRHCVTEKLGAIQSQFGLGASPCQSADRVFVLIEQQGPSFLAAFDKATGEVAWSVERESRQSWGSPVYATVHGRPMLIVDSAGSVDGYDATTGKLLWSLGEIGGNTCSTSLLVDGDRFLVGASPGPRGETAGVAKRSNLCCQIVPDEKGGFEAKVLWRAERATTSFGSPIVYQGHAYFVNDTGIVHCIDAATGETVYAERIGQSIWATPLGVADRIYFFGKDGETTVLAAGPQFEVLAHNVLWESGGDAPRTGADQFSGPTQYGYAVDGNAFLIRTGKSLYCVHD